MPEMSNYLKQAIADYFLRPSATAPARPTSHFCSLWSAIIDSDAGTGTELVTGTSPGYVRGAIVWGTISLPSGQISNSLTAVFATATADWLQATHYGMHDHLGNLLQSLTALAAPVTVLSGKHAEGTAGSFVLTLS